MREVSRRGDDSILAAIRFYNMLTAETSVYLFSVFCTRISMCLCLMIVSRLKRCRLIGIGQQ